MTTFERRQSLIDLLRERPGLRVPEIAQVLGVSEGTVRNDLNALEADGLLTRVRGGAVLRETFQPSSPSFAARINKSAAAKQAIARWAADLVEDGDSILLDASTTVYEMARYLHNRRRLRVVTNGIEVARLLAQNPTNTVILLAGVVNQDGSSITGPLSEQVLRELHIQTAFVSCSGFSLENGLTEVHLAEAQLKRQAIASSEKLVALVDAGKFGLIDLTPFARTEQISHLYTDASLAPAWRDRLRGACLTYTICAADDASTFTPCDQNGDPQGGPPRHYRLGFANLSETSSFAVDVRRGLERAARQAGNVDLVLADNRLDADTALKVADHFLSQSLDLVIEYQIDEQIGNRLMSRFQSAGLPVIAVDIPIVGATFFGVDNFRAGLMAGTALGEWLRDHWDGRYGCLLKLIEPRAGSLPAARIQGQMEGLQAVLGSIPPEKCLELNCGNTREIAAQVVKGALRNLPAGQRLAVLSFNDDAALGALDAARSLGRAQEMAIVGQGGDRLMREELSRPDTRVIGSTAFYPDKYGGQLISLALRILRGEPVPPAVYMDHTFVTSEALQ